MATRRVYYIAPRPNRAIFALKVAYVLILVHFRCIWELIMERRLQIKCSRCNIFTWREVSESEVQTWISSQEQSPHYPEFPYWHECPDGGYGINTALGFTPSSIFVAQEAEDRVSFDITGKRFADEDEEE
jgi:hypothetical protein